MFVSNSDLVAYCSVIPRAEYFSYERAPSSALVTAGTMEQKEGRCILLMLVEQNIEWNVLGSV